jgi:two-component system response regulator
MQPHGVEILLVEDNDNDAELTLRALQQRNLANQVHLCRDGAEAVDYIVKPVDFDAFARAVSDVGLYWLLLNHPPQ